MVIPKKGITPKSFIDMNEDQIAQRIQTGTQLKTIRELATASFNVCTMNPDFPKNQNLTDSICAKLSRAVKVKKFEGGFFRYLFYTFAEVLRIPTEIDRANAEIKRLRLHSYILQHPEKALDHLNDPIVTTEIKFANKYDGFQLSEMKNPDEQAYFMIAVVNGALRKNDKKLFPKADLLLKKEWPFLEKVKDQEILEKWNKKKRLVAFLNCNEMTLDRVNSINKFYSKDVEEIDIKKRLERIRSKIEDPMVPEENKKVLIYDVLEWVEDRSHAISPDEISLCFLVLLEAKEVDLEGAQELQETILRRIEQEKIIETIEKISSDEVRFNSIIGELKNVTCTPEVKAALLYYVIGWVRRSDVDDQKCRDVFIQCNKISKSKIKLDSSLLQELENALVNKVQQVHQMIVQGYQEQNVKKLRQQLVGIKMNNKKVDNVPVNNSIKSPHLLDQYARDLLGVPALSINGKAIYFSEDKPSRGIQNIQQDVEEYLGEKKVALAIQPLLNQGTQGNQLEKITSFLKGEWMHINGSSHEFDVTKSDGNVVITINSTFQMIIESETMDPIGYFGAQTKITLPEDELQTVIPSTNKEGWEELIPNARVEESIGKFVPVGVVGAEMQALSSVAPDSALVNKPKVRPFPEAFKQYCKRRYEEIAKDEDALEKQQKTLFEQITNFVGVREAWSVISLIDLKLWGVEEGDKDPFRFATEGKNVMITLGNKTLTIPSEVLSKNLVEVDPKLGIQAITRIYPSAELTTVLS